MDRPLFVASSQDSHTQGVDDASRDQFPVEQEPPKVHKKRKRSRHRPHSSTEVSHTQGDDDVTRQAAQPPALTSTEVSHSQGDDDVTRQAAQPPALTLDPDEPLILTSTPDAHTQGVDDASRDQPLVEQVPAKIHRKRKRLRHRPHSSTEVSHTQGDVTRQAARPPALTSTEVSHSQGDDDVTRQAAEPPALTSTEVSHSQVDDDVTRQEAEPPALTSTEVSHSQGDDDVTRQAAEPPALTLDPQEDLGRKKKRKHKRHVLEAPTLGPSEEALIVPQAKLGSEVCTADEEATQLLVQVESAKIHRKRKQSRHNLEPSEEKAGDRHKH